MRYIIAIIIFFVVAGLLYIRLAPFDTDRFHRASFPVKVGDYPARNAFTAVRAITADAEEVVAALDDIILATPRTQRMAGMPGTDVITYQTRSAIMGFPDYTNVAIIPPGAVDNSEPLLSIRGQARFGLDDLGVNEARIRGWLDALGPLTVEP